MPLSAWRVGRKPILYLTLRHKVPPWLGECGGPAYFWIWMRCHLEPAEWGGGGPILGLMTNLMTEPRIRQVV